jgi:hypothetical protein
MAPVQQIKMGDICDGFVETPGDTLRAARGKVYSIITFPLIVMTNPRDAKDERASRDVLLNKEDLMRLALCDNCDFKRGLLRTTSWSGGLRGASVMLRRI